MTKTEQRAESWAYAKALDAIAIPLLDELGQPEAYRMAGEQLKGWAMPVEQKAQGALKSDF